MRIFKAMIRLTGGGGRKKHLFSIRAQLILAFMLMIIPVSILGKVSYDNSANTLKELAQKSAIQTFTQASKYLEMVFFNMQEVYIQVMSNPDVQDAISSNLETDKEKQRKINDMLKSVSATGKTISNITLLIDGYYFSSCKNDLYIDNDPLVMIPPSIFKTFAESSIFKKALENDGKKILWIGTRPEFYNYINSKSNAYPYSITAVSKINSLNYRTRKKVFIFIDINPELLNNLISSVDLGSGSEMYLISPDGEDISSTMKNSPVVYRDYYKAFQDSTEDTGVISSFYKGEDHMVIYKKIGDTGFILTGFIPYRELLSSAGKISTLTIILVFIAITAAVGLGLYMAFGMGSTINDIIHVAKCAADGDLSVIPKNKRKDEFGDLTESIGVMITNMKRLIDQAYKQKILAQKAELKQLQSQINPHFLYNSLDCIQGLAFSNKSSEIVNIASSLSKVFRYSIKSGNIVYIKDEVSCVRDYLSIISVRFNNRYEFTIDIEERITDLKTIKFILQPIVENAVHHGLEPVGEGFLSIKGFSQGNTDICFEICDNGKGINNSKLLVLNQCLNSDTSSNFLDDDNDKGMGIGIVNVNNRIKLHFGNQYGIQLFSKENEGTKVVIVIPRIAD